MTTPGQTVGPFFAMALPRDGEQHLVPPGAPGAVRLTGRVLDGDGAPVPDAVLEICCPDAYGRAATDADGRYEFTLRRPTHPFVPMAVLARGLLDRLFTRVYLAADAHNPDPLLGQLDPERRATLIATDTGDELHFDVRLQGERETVFLTFPGHQP